MEIGALNTRLIFQKNHTLVDKYKNHISGWSDYYSCWATCITSGLNAEETENAGRTQEADRLDITVRWCSEIAAVNSREFRILLNGRIYNIVSIDEMGFRRRSRKFHTILTAR